MDVKVLVFGQLTEITGLSELVLTGVSSSEQLIEILVERFPALAHSKYAIALNNKVINQDTPLTSNSLVALLPPFSGG